MESKILECEVITPMFCYGANKNNPELRPSSIKGMMRYMFRISQLTLRTEELLKQENELFGDAIENPSPVRLAILGEKIKSGSSQFLFHKKTSPRNFISLGTRFNLRVSLRSNLQPSKDIHFYESLLELSFLLIGIGGRSRKGRGRVQSSSTFPKSLSAEEMKQEIRKCLNKLAISSEYELTGDEIKPLVWEDKKIKRPVIEKIEFGQPIQKQRDKEAWKILLTRLDDASSQTKHEYNKGEKRTCRVLGQASSPRFSSSLIVGAVETADGLLPIYTCVRAVAKQTVLQAEDEWNSFIKKMEAKGGNRS